MFLELAHTKLDVFKISKEFVLSCYKETRSFPSEDRFAMIQQIRRAALSVHLNVAEGCSRKSAIERKRFYEIARGSVIEIDTAFDIAFNLGYTSKEKLADLGILLIRCFQLVSKMISS
ncbi:MAG TPA: four helix bundle protein [Chitinophagaceae bacterium]|jgi:four helix bundle protein|nr:four helix bundle protein [Chitinophagaceae bacterium]